MQGAKHNKTTGVRGVSYDYWSGKLAAKITFRRESYYLGRFDSIDEAAAAVDDRRMMFRIIEWAEKCLPKDGVGEILPVGSDRKPYGPSPVEDRILANEAEEQLDTGDPMTLERDLERYLQTQVKRRGGIALKLAPTVKGVPDRLILAPGGGLYLVELKTETGRLSPAQNLWHDRAAAIGVEVATLWGKDQIREWLDAHLPA